MLFTSYLFLFGFLPPVLVGWWSLRHKHVRLGLPDGSVVGVLRLVGPGGVADLLVSTSVDYIAGIINAPTN